MDIVSQTILVPFLIVLDKALELYLWAVIAAIVIFWLYHFNVLSRSNRLVAAVSDFLDRMTQPALRWIGRVVPMIGGVDLSPIVLFLGIEFVRMVIGQIVARMG